MSFTQVSLNVHDLLGALVVQIAVRISYMRGSLGDTCDRNVSETRAFPSAFSLSTTREQRRVLRLRRRAVDDVRATSSGQLRIIKRKAEWKRNS